MDIVKFMARAKKLEKKLKKAEAQVASIIAEMNEEHVFVGFRSVFKGSALMYLNKEKLYVKDENGQWVLEGQRKCNNQFRPTQPINKEADAE